MCYTYRIFIQNINITQHKRATERLNTLMSFAEEVDVRHIHAVAVKQRGICSLPSFDGE